MANLTFSIRETDIENSRNCIACGERNFSPISDCRLPNNLEFLSTSICNQCGHVFRNTRPSRDWFNRNFKKRYNFQKDLNWNPINPAIEEQRYQRYYAIGSMIKKKYSQHESFLDVGCGPGTGFDALNKLGFKTEGIESDESRSVIGKEKGHNIYEGDWEEFQSKKQFDVISSIHSLEHFHNPGMFLSKIRSLAHQETLLYIEVPEILDHVIDWNDSLYLAHLSNFNENSLITLARRSGWSLLDRVHPYAHSSLHKNHLSMLFKYSEIKDSDSLLTASQDQNALKSKIIETYKRNLPLVPDNFHSTHFTVKEINDLSLTFKENREVREVVHDNYQGRKVSRLNGNHFLVS